MKLPLRGVGACGICLVMCLSALALIRTVCGPGPSAHVAILLPDHDCGMVCWNAIEPGVTDFKTARTLITQNLNIVAAELDNRWQFAPDDDHVHTVHLEAGIQPARAGNISLTPDEVRLGDMLLALGEPDYLVVRFEVQARQYRGTRYIELYHPDYGLSVTVSLQEGERLSPQSPLSGVHYFEQPLARPVYAQRWQGFTSVIQTVYTLDES
jgi:hypothetical protein